MKTTKRFFLTAVLVLLALCIVRAQTVKTKKASQKVRTENMEGYEAEVEGMMDDVSSSFIKYLKAFGKVKQSPEGITLTEATIGGTSYTLPVYAMVRENSKTSSAWIGIKMAEWGEDGERMLRELEKLVYEFGVKFYRDKIQLQIDEAVRALQTVEKQQQRLSNENRNLSTKLENNKKEKIQLEQAIINNKNEHQTLLKKLEQNKTAQDSVAVAAEQIKKVVDMHRERQRKVQ
jgi:hypothetical protein